MVKARNENNWDMSGNQNWNCIVNSIVYTKQNTYNLLEYYHDYNENFLNETP